MVAIAENCSMSGSAVCVVLSCSYKICPNISSLGKGKFKAEK